MLWTYSYVGLLLVFGGGGGGMVCVTFPKMMLGWLLLQLVMHTFTLGLLAGLLAPLAATSIFSPKNAYPVNFEDV